MLHRLKRTKLLIFYNIYFYTRTHMRILFALCASKNNEFFLLQRYLIYFILFIRCENNKYLNLAIF